MLCLHSQWSDPRELRQRGGRNAAAGLNRNLTNAVSASQGVPRGPFKATSSKEPSQVTLANKNTSPPNLGALAIHGTHLAPMAHPQGGRLASFFLAPSSLFNTLMFALSSPTEL